MDDNKLARQAEELLETLTQKDLVSFMRSLIVEDDAICIRLLRRFAPFDPVRATDDLLYDLRQAERDHSAYGDGYVDWRHVFDFGQEIRRIVDVHLTDALSHKAYAAALALGFEAYLFVNHVDVDDSGGFYDNTVDILDETWDALYEQALADADEDLLRLLFRELRAYVSSPAIRDRAFSQALGLDIYDEQCDHIESYLCRRFCDIAAFAPDVCEIVDGRLASILRFVQAEEDRNARMDHPADFGRYWLREATRWTRVRLQAMRAMGETYEVRLAYARPYLSQEQVCLLLVDEAEQTGNDEEALRLIDERLEEVASNGALAPHWVLARAVGLYERKGDANRVRALLEDLVVSGANAADALTWFSMLKERCSADEWQKVRKRAFERVRQDDARWRYYVAEGLFDLLMDEVETRGASSIGSFEEHLVPRFPDRVLALYRTELLGSTRSEPPVGSSRRSYESYAQKVSHLRTIEGGDEVADAIIREVLDRYPRRSALRDELGRA